MKAFTLTELLVVLFIIILILGIAIPSFPAMMREARVAGAYTTISSILQQAKILSQIEHNVMAVRIMPAEWAIDEKTARDRQCLVIYRWVCSTDDKESGDLNRVVFHEHLERYPGIDIALLPTGVWAAPLKATSDFKILEGDIGEFFNDPNEPDFFNADDFLIVFFKGRELVGRPYHLELWEYDPVAGYDQFFHRNRYKGVVIYSREPVLDVARHEDALTRQEILIRLGRRYFVDFNTGTLLPAH
jgi:competence protein ComGC